MKYIHILVFTFSILVTVNLHAQNETSSTASVPSAYTVLKRAVVEAGQQNKKVLLIFHASWCGWCHKMDTALNDITVKKFFDDNFVITHITVKESKEKEKLENAGGYEMMQKYNGTDQGLPYWVILDKDHNLLFDSQVRKKQPDGSVKGQNVGCPASQPEVDMFIDVLKKTTSLTAPQLALIAKRFRQNEK